MEFALLCYTYQANMYNNNEIINNIKSFRTACAHSVVTFHLLDHLAIASDGNNYSDRYSFILPAC